MKRYTGYSPIRWALHQPGMSRKEIMTIVEEHALAAAEEHGVTWDNIEFIEWVGGPAALEDGTWVFDRHGDLIKAWGLLWKATIEDPAVDLDTTDEAWVERVEF